MGDAVGRKQVSHLTQVPNSTYNLLTLSQNTLQSIEALQRYKRDAEDDGNTDLAALLDEIERHELEIVDLLDNYIRHVARGLFLRGHGM